MRGYFIAILLCLSTSIITVRGYAGELQGTSDQKPVIDSIETIKGLAEMNEPEQQLKLGDAYHQGIGVDKDDAKAIYWWQRAATGKDPSSAIVRRLSDALLISSLKQKADRGDTWAQLELGVNYHEGWGVNKDDKQALALIYKSADQGNTKAQFQLCSSLYTPYHNAEEMAVNEKEEVKWCLKAADQGDTEAQVQLGYDYLMGLGIEGTCNEKNSGTCNVKEANDKGAFQWWQKAAAQGSLAGEDMLAGCYMKGIWVKRDDKQTLKMEKELALRHDPLAQSFIDNYNECGEWRSCPYPYKAEKKK